MSINLGGEIRQAIKIAWDPRSTSSDKSQAIDFINQLRSNPECWKACLQIFIEEGRDRSDPTVSDVLRHFCLEALSYTIRQPSPEPIALEQIQAALFDYAFQTYSPSSAGVVDTPHIQNKLSEVFTALFVVLYSSTLPEFFRRLRTLACGDANGSNVTSFNPTGALFFLRVLISIHDEIADVLITRHSTVAALHSRLKDQIRERDVNTVVELWSTVLTQWDQISPDISDACLKSVSRWVQWIEISLVVRNRQIMSSLCMIVNPNFLPPGPIVNSEMIASRTKLLYTAVDSFTAIVSKKALPDKKVELIRLLDLTNLVTLLIQSRQLSEFQGTEHYDNDLAEIVAKLVNAVMVDIVFTLDSRNADHMAASILEACRTLVAEYLPFILRFMSDQYDSVSHSVIGATTNLVTWYRKVAEKNSPQAVEGELSSILASTISKMQYDSSIDEDVDLEEIEEAFTDLRKKLSIIQKMIADIHRPLFVNAINALIDQRFNQYKVDTYSLTWRSVEVALYELSLYSDVYPRIGMVGTDGQRTQSMVDEVIKRIAAMIEIDISSYPHTTTQLLYLDVCTRFLPVFEIQPELIQPALGAYIRLAHSTEPKVRRKAWSALSRFVGANIGKHLKPISKAVMMGLEDLMAINANAADILTDEALSEDDRMLDEEFKAQLSLFETVGSLLALVRSDPAEFNTTTQAILGSFCNAINLKMEAAKNGGGNELLAIHHNIMALGTIAHKLGASQSTNFDQNLARVFEAPSSAVLSALLTLNANKSVRIASRFTLTRLVDVLRVFITPQLESWLSVLLGSHVSAAELVQFLPVLSQMVFILQTDMEVILDSKLSMIVNQVHGLLNSPVTGTDDQILLVELQKEYFTFILYCLGHNMGGMFRSEQNNQTFQNVILYLQTAAKGETPFGNFGLALKLINKILTIYGGPGDVLGDDVVAELGIPQSQLANNIRNTKMVNQVSGTSEVVSPFAMPQFVEFVIDIFHPLVWVMPTNAQFRIQDSEGKEVMKEILVLQVLLTQKAGGPFLKRMMADLSSIPQFGSESAVEYLTQLYNTAMYRLSNSPATTDTFTYIPGNASAGTVSSTIPFAADPKIKEFRKYFEGVVVHIRRQKGIGS